MFGPVASNNPTWDAYKAAPSDDTLNAVLADFRPYVKALVRAQLNQKHSAQVDDVVQEVLLDAWKALPTANNPTSLIRTIATRRCIDHVRHAAVAPAEQLVSDEMVMDAARAPRPQPRPEFNRFSDAERKLVFYLEWGYTVQDIARETNQNKATVYRTIRRMEKKYDVQGYFHRAARKERV